MILKNKILRLINSLFCALTMTTVLSSCSMINDSPEPVVPPEPEPEPAQTTILIYAVATNSLSVNLTADKSEMLVGASEIDLDKNNIFVFETQYKYNADNKRTSNVALVKLVKDKETGECEWETVGEYNDGVGSLNPTRIREIINYVTENNESDHYGLIFWSHSTASQPYFDDTTRGEKACDETNRVSLPMQYSFGQDLTYSNGDAEYQINIDDLSAAVPDNLFDFIWFDSCYMSNIETIYQFRNKCNTFVGYPTEVLDAGLPYQYAIPKMVGGTPDLVGAAEEFFSYYSDKFGTIAVVDMTKIETLAEACARLYGKYNVSSGSLMKYSRYSTGPFYDLGDYTKELVNQGGGELTQEEWEEILQECVLYSATTTKYYLPDLNVINKERFSGISTHLYTFLENDSEAEAFYKSLDWYKRVFENE